MIERSQGKARCLRPRSSDLKPVESVRDPSEGRDSHGRAAPGNRLSIGQGWKATIRRATGLDAGNPVVEQLARDTTSIYFALLRQLPDDGPQVRPLVAERARSIVLSGYYANRAAEVGLDTDAGRAALELSMKLGQRAERTAISALDIATKLASAKPKTNPALEWLTKPLPTTGETKP